MDTSLAIGFPELPELSRSFTSPPNKIGQSDVVEALATFGD
jgi:hypothetical protein